MDLLSSMIWPEATSYANDDQNPAVLDFPLTFGEEKKKAKKSPKQTDEKHPYPVSISIQMNTEPSSSPVHEQRRSPTSSPGDRSKKSSIKVKETRQPNSPIRSVNKDARSSELQEYHERGRKQFLCNHLAGAVDSYTHAIRAGLEEMSHRKEMMNRMRSTHQDKDIFTLESGGSVAQVHLDLAFALEIAGKYAESAEELSNGRGMLKHTCHKKKDNRIRECMKNIERMERAAAVEDERKKQRSKMESALKKVEGYSSQEEKDSARKKAIGTIKQLLRIERDSLGEQSYAVAKLKLKIAKARYEGNDLEGALQDADAAMKTLRHVLGANHTLVGAACLFAASVNEKLISILSSTEVIDPKPISKGMTPQCKSKIKRALELYAEAVGPLKLKYSDGDKTKLQPELGDVFQRIARLYGKEGSYMSAVDAYQSSLEAYGAAAVRKSDLFCPDAVSVWHNLGELHFIMSKYHDALYAARKCTELAKILPKLSSDESIVFMSISSFQIEGDAYAAMNRHNDATRSYQEALNAFRNARSNSRVKKNFSSMDEARMLKKIGNSLLHEDKASQAKTNLLDAVKCLRSDKKVANSSELPMLLSNIGHAHIRCGDYTEAMKFLRSCLKCYSDQGVSDRSPEVARAKQLYKEAQYGPDHQSESPDEARAIRPSPPMSPQRTIATQSTAPSTAYSSKMSSGVYSGATLNSVQSQLQSLLEQLQLSGGYNAQSTMSPGNSQLSPHDNHLPPIAEINPSEFQEMEHETNGHLVESLIKRIQAKVNFTEYEPDLQEKKRERILASVDRNIAFEDASKSADHISTLEAELKSVRKELDASDSSYKHLLKVVDETKENTRVTHEIEKTNLEREIMSLRQQQKETAANGNLTNSLSDEITCLRREIHHLKEQNKNSAEEVAMLESTNRTLQAGNDTAMSEIDSLNETIDTLKDEAYRMSNGSVAEVKKLEYELKKGSYMLNKERSRRMILEASIEKENDNRGGFAYHPMMPFGYQVGPDKNLKTLEIDLATERANVQMLEGIVKEMTVTHEQEVNKLAVQLRDVPNLVLQLEEHERRNDVLSIELSETKLERESVQKKNEDVLNELSDAKGLLLQISSELSTLMEEKSALSDACSEDRDALEFTKKELAETLTALNTAQSELTTEKEASHINVAEKNQLHEDHDCLKKEFKEALVLFQSEIEEARRMKEGNETSYEREVDRLKSEQAEFFYTKNEELDDTRLHLKNVLTELQEAEDSRDTFQTEVQKLEMALENTRHELELNTEELFRATEEVETMRAFFEEAESARSKLEEYQAQQQTDQDKKFVELESSLCLAEKTIRELEDNRKDLNSRLSKIIDETETNKKQVKSALPVLKKVSAALGMEVEECLVDDDDVLLRIISNNIESVVEAKNKELQASAWNLSNTVNELDLLEKKHRQLKDELTVISELRAEHNELLQECKQLSKDLLEVNVEKEEAQERCDLHKSRLKDAVDDLEELEYERDELKEELDQAFEDSARLEMSLRDMIGALEDENTRLQKYESATVDFDAAVWGKDQKLKQLKEELNAAHSQLTLLRASATRNGREEGQKAIYPDILPETQNDFEELASLRSIVHTLEERNLELSEKLANLEVRVDTDASNEETGYDGSEVETLTLRVSELSDLNENLEQELSKMRTYVDEVEIQRTSNEIQEDMVALNEQVNELAQQLQESQEEVMKAATTHTTDVEAITSLQDARANKDKHYKDELKQVELLRDINSSLEERLATTVPISKSKEMDQSKPSSEDVISLKAQVRGLEVENGKMSALLAESQAETIDASRTHADDQETIFELKNALEEQNELLQRSQQETPDHKDEIHQAELNEWIIRVDTLENEVRELKNQESECDECEQRNLQFANVMETLNDLQIENQGLKTEIILWETADDGGVGQKVNFEKEMNAAHKRFVSMEKSLQESIKRLEKEKEKLVAAHNDEISNKIDQHDKTRIELSAWKLEMQNALNDIESLKKENDDLRSSFEAVSQSKVQTAFV